MIRLATICCLCLVACRSDPPPAQSPKKPQPTQPKAPVKADRLTIQAADVACADCHPDEVDAWLASPMGRSVGPVDPKQLPNKKITVRHPITNTPFTVESTPAGLEFTIGSGKDAVRRIAQYVVGSGIHTRSYFWPRGDALFEAPMTWYRGRDAWDLSPGYAIGKHPGLFREANDDCLFCHADPPVRLRKARFKGPLRPIGCNRCHGDGQAHIKGRLAGDPTPILTPKALPTDRRDAICESCHLTGVVRLLQPGRGYGDFQPGMALDEVFLVYARERADARFGIASHAERLSRSACAQKSDAQLSCTTCHQPHATTQTQPAAACVTCHTEQTKQCAGPGTPDCVGCHMAHGGASDIPHIAVTDHFIRRRPQAHAPNAKLRRIKTDAPLVRIGGQKKVPLEQLMLGRAYAEAFRLRGARADLVRAKPLLEGQIKDSKSVDAWLDLAFVRQQLGDLAGSLDALEHALQIDPTDRRVGAATSAARFRAGRGGQVIEALEPALIKHPDHVPLQLLHAQLATGAGHFIKAQQAVDMVLVLEPTSGQGWLAQATLHLAQGHLADAQISFDTAARHAPGDPAVWRAIGAFATHRGQKQTAEKAHKMVNWLADPSQPRPTLD